MWGGSEGVGEELREGHMTRCNPAVRRAQCEGDIYYLHHWLMCRPSRSLAHCRQGSKILETTPQIPCTLCARWCCQRDKNREGQCSFIEHTLHFLYSFGICAATARTGNSAVVGGRKELRNSRQSLYCIVLLPRRYEHRQETLYSL